MNLLDHDQRRLVRELVRPRVRHRRLEIVRLAVLRVQFGRQDHGPVNARAVQADGEGDQLGQCLEVRAGAEADGEGLADSDCVGDVERAGCCMLCQYTCAWMACKEKRGTYSACSRGSSSPRRWRQRQRRQRAMQRRWLSSYCLEGMRVKWSNWFGVFAVGPFIYIYIYPRLCFETADRNGDRAAAQEEEGYYLPPIARGPAFTAQARECR